MDHVTVLQQGRAHGALPGADFMGDFRQSAQSGGSADTLSVSAAFLFDWAVFIKSFACLTQSAVDDASTKEPSEFFIIFQPSEFV